MLAQPLQKSIGVASTEPGSTPKNSRRIFYRNRWPLRKIASFLAIIPPVGQSGAHIFIQTAYNEPCGGGVINQFMQHII
jgi:hypothetical protein